MSGIKSLAKHLDISIGTVSRALNGRPNVDAETRKRVLKAADELGYAPNQAGRSLRQGKTGVIGFMMYVGGGTDAFFINVFHGVQSVLAEHELDLVALLCAPDEDPDAFIRRTVARRFVDAIILSETRRTDERIAYLAERDIPFIALGRSETAADYPWIDLDFEGMADVALGRLLAQGHRKIGICLPERNVNLKTVFLNRYRAILQDHGIDFRTDYVFYEKANEAGGYRVAGRIADMADPPTAFVLINDVMSVGFYRGLFERGVMPGRDLAVIARESAQSPFLIPKLTCFRLSRFELGAQLARGLLANMPGYADKYGKGDVRMLWPFELIEGESDGPAGLDVTDA